MVLKVLEASLDKCRFQCNPTLCVSAPIGLSYMFRVLAEFVGLFKISADSERLEICFAVSLMVFYFILSCVKSDLEDMDFIMSNRESNLTEQLLPLKHSFFIRESRSGVRHTNVLIRGAVFGHLVSIFSLSKYGIDRKQIGRLEVGSETVIDKSKSIKTFLMQIFEECGNTDIEGVDSTNACYGGTAALFNCVNWVESSSWDGRYGLVVCTDSAVYAEGPARPTGGAAAIAMLIGPDAPIAFESKFRGSHMSHAYDFYNPNLASEYPVVDGKLSQICYLMALDSCYKRFCAKFEKWEGKPFSISEADYFVFHSPYNKLVQKSFARLCYDDFLRDPSFVEEAAREKLSPFSALSGDESYQSRDLEKTGKRVMMFSYGSGLTATMFSFKLGECEYPFSLSNIATVMNVSEKLKSRHEKKLLKS